MFFFFVGGVEQQVRQVLKSGAGKCFSCGGKADLVDYDKVLKLFFVPTWKWPAKQPAMYCRDCNLFFPPPPTVSDAAALTESSLRCRFCDRLVDSDFRFCPFCGSSL